jgi:hypothetical protein
MGEMVLPYRKYTLKWQARKPYKAVETRCPELVEWRIVAVPRCTVVSGQIDLDTGGDGGDPDEKAKYLK